MGRLSSPDNTCSCISSMSCLLSLLFFKGNDKIPSVSCHNPHFGGGIFHYHPLVWIKATFLNQFRLAHTWVFGVFHNHFLLFPIYGYWSFSRFLRMVSFRSSSPGSQAAYSGQFPLQPGFLLGATQSLQGLIFLLLSNSKHLLHCGQSPLECQNSS